MATNNRPRVVIGQNGNLGPARRLMGGLLAAPALGFAGFVVYTALRDPRVPDAVHSHALPLGYYASWDEQMVGLGLLLAFGSTALAWLALGVIARLPAMQARGVRED